MEPLAFRAAAERSARYLCVLLLRRSVTAPARSAPEAALRIDRWLWCARFYKTRSLAAHAVRAGHVRLNGRRVKPAHDVKIGDSIAIDATRDEYAISVAALPGRRGPSPEAQSCYVETPESVERRTVEVQRRAAAALVLPPTDSRPDKRTRRLLLRARGRTLISRRELGFFG